jgi:RIO kinase 1
MNEQEYLEDIDDLDLSESLLVRRRVHKSQSVRANNATLARSKFVRDQDDSSRTFDFTYKAARFEEGWLLESLGDLYEHGWIADVLARVKGGKEANVYCCRGGTALDRAYAAAKVYRPRSMRNLKNDHLYREGRVDLDLDGHAIVKGGELRAIRHRTQFGRDLQHQSWITYEFTTLQRLHASGLDVPAPYASAPNAVLMAFVGDDLAAAPALNEISLDRAEARHLFERMVHNVDGMLSQGVIHGDLSAYNVLYWEGEITLIDFPQVVQPDGNASAWPIFRRDVARLCEYFGRQGVRANAARLAEDLWRAHGHRLQREADPRFLDGDSGDDRALWEQQQKYR